MRQRPRRLFLSGSDLANHRDHLPHHKRQCYENRRDRHSWGRVDHAEIMGGQPIPKPSGIGVHQ